MLKTLICLQLSWIILVGFVSSQEDTKECNEFKLNYPQQLVKDDNVCEKILASTTTLNAESNSNLPGPMKTCKCNLIAKDIYWLFLQTQRTETIVNKSFRGPELEELELKIQEEEQKENEDELKVVDADEKETTEESEESDNEEDDDDDELGDAIDITPIEDVEDESSLESSWSKVDPLILTDAIQHGVCKSIESLPPIPFGEDFPSYYEFKYIDRTTIKKEEIGLKFEFASIAPVAYQKIRARIELDNNEYVSSMSCLKWIEISNPGKSGSGMYISGDSKYIIKTLQPEESLLLQKLLPKYYTNLCYNGNSLISSFLGQYIYSRHMTEFSLVIMRNIMPTNLKIHRKYDLKGSTHGRTASERERSKKSPTFKDLDFMEHYPEGIILEPQIYDSLMKSIDHDLDFLRAAKITDFSLLLGIHNLDSPEGSEIAGMVNLNSLEKNSPWSAIPATNKRGEKLLLFIGIIDVLQKYKLKKKLEYTYKSITIDADSISVQEPSIYCERFKKFMANTVFKKG